MERNPLAQLRDFGQSVWCDDIGRDFLLQGRLKELIRRDKVAGLTSNPTIFHKAITQSTSYDESFKKAVGQGAKTGEIMDALMIEDIQLAADELALTFDETSTADGWVSIEVPPHLAHDTAGTIAEVKRLKTLVDRPNVFVKVPATEEGVAAVHDLTAQGYSINITLIFSLVRYRQIMEAYISGLEALSARGSGARQGEGAALYDLSGVHSVASFFVSRVDTLVDKRLDERAAQVTQESGNSSPFLELKGKAAVANAKQAYHLFTETFSGNRWEALRSREARVQRPLWASTSTKNPAYSDILYVQELIGPDSVNTMPLSTMEAFRDHGVPRLTITEGLTDAEYHLAALRAAGIDMEEIGMQLEREGVKAFADSHDVLFSALDEKREAVEAQLKR